MPDSGDDEAAAQSDSDEQLMSAFCGGSPAAFTELFSRYKQPLFGFFRRRVQDPHHAEELTQDTFVAVLRGSARYQQSALFRTYLYAIGLNILRAHRRRVAIQTTFSKSEAGESEPSAPDTIHTILSIREAVGKLKAEEREVLLLREFEQLSYAEIAALLKLPINTVRSRLFRARMALRDLLAVTESTLAAARTRKEEHL